MGTCGSLPLPDSNALDSPDSMPLLPQRIRFCKAPDGVRLAYSTAGSGPPLVWAAPWLTHLELDWESPVWRPWYRELGPERTLVRYDSRGCGLSDWNFPELSFDRLLSDLECVVDAAGARRSVMLGIMDSTPLAVAYAARHPDRVSHLILVGGFARGRLQRETTVRMREEDDALAKLIAVGWDQENPAFRQLYTTLYLPEGTPEQQRAFNRTVQASMSPENATRRLLLGYQTDVSSLAAQVRCPTLIVHASKDARVPMEEARRLATLIPESKFVLLQSANRIFLEQEPAWSRFVQEVGAFLGGDAGVDASLAALTPRERELLGLLAQGLDNLQIASQSGLSEKTVRNSNSRIFAKLGVENRSMAIVRAREAGLGKRNA
jgi:pimeloyl-ACP methyl ester carboxylesterase/DNA-binding CsgD family transcriptional regulator